MWPPRTLEQLRAVLAEPNLQESAVFDVKTELPAKGKSADLAVDVAAMTPDGGMIVYGIAEAPNGLSEQPIALAGTVERITSIVNTTIAEPPAIEAFTVESGPGVGFVIVAVPASERAPHMVQVKGEWRYYGRGPGGNRPLTEGEVARLYARRTQYERSVAELIDEAVAASPRRDPSATEASLYVVVQPLASDTGMRERAWPSGEGFRQRLRDAVLSAGARMRFSNPTQPDMRTIVEGPVLRTVSGHKFVAPTGGSRGDQTELEIGDNGAIRLFTDTAAHLWRSELVIYETLTLRDDTIAQLTTGAIAAGGALSRQAGYFGAVDVAAAIVGAEQAISALRHQVIIGLTPTGTRLPDPYIHGGRWPASELVNAPVAVARAVVGPFLDAARQNGPDAFETRT